MPPKVLEVNNLSVSFKDDGTWIRVIEGVAFELYQGEVLGIVGESGCGKSVTMSSILGLLPQGISRVDRGSAFLCREGEQVDLLKVRPRDMKNYRGNAVSMIFQDSLTGLNPVLTVGKQLVEAIRAHNKFSKKMAQKLAVEMLHKVGIREPRQRMREYPHQFSGGMRQRIMIAMAIVNEPAVLVADEPTTALDVTIQSQILDLLDSISIDLDASMILITHDMGVVASRTHRVIVMYSGQVVEVGETDDIFARPLHPYTVGLLNSIPHLNQDRNKPLNSIPGTVPTHNKMPSGCRFNERCSHCMEICKSKTPSLLAVAGRKVRCWRYANGK